MPLLMGIGSNDNAPYAYFPKSSKYGIAERNTSPPAGPTVAPTPTGVPTGTGGLLTQAKAQLKPTVDKVVAAAKANPWWVLAGLGAAYVLTRRGGGDAGPPQTVHDVG